MTTVARHTMAATKVLAVDDDPLICQVMTEMLAAEGFQLECVGNDRDAIRRLDANSYTALIVDINLGAGVTGFDLARHARRLDPAVAVIYVSGQAAKGTFKTLAVRGGVFVEKPFTGDQLREAIAQALGERR